MDTSSRRFLPPPPPLPHAESRVPFSVKVLHCREIRAGRLWGLQRGGKTVMEERKSEQRSTSRGQTSSRLSVGAKDIVPTHGHTQKNSRKATKAFPEFLGYTAHFHLSEERSEQHKEDPCLDKENRSNENNHGFPGWALPSTASVIGPNVKPLKQTPQINISFHLPCFAGFSVHCPLCTAGFTVQAIRNKSAENNPLAGVKALLMGWPVPSSWPADRFMHS